MGILKKATNKTAFAKVGIQGFQGAGKTRTAAELAIGIAKNYGGGKPVAMFDTENGIDFVQPLFDAAGVELLEVRSRAFKDLMTFMREAETECCVAIIDSITHVWRELVESYERRLGRKYGLQIQDWGPLKTEWRHFSDIYVSSRTHLVLCGRAGDDLEEEVDEKTGKRNLTKVGTKMLAEKELGYEPSLLIEMQRIKTAEPEAGQSGWVNRAFVLKDRADRMNGAAIDYPKFDHFRPHFDFLNIGGEHSPINTESNSEDMFDDPEMSAAEYRRQVEVCLDEIKAEFAVNDMDGTSKEAKRKRIETLDLVFNTKSWKKVESMRLADLQTGLVALRDHFNPPAETDGGWVGDEPEECLKGECGHVDHRGAPTCTPNDLALGGDYDESTDDSRLEHPPEEPEDPAELIKSDPLPATS